MRRAWGGGGEEYHRLLYYDEYFYLYFLAFARIISLTLILPPLISIFTKGQGLPQQRHAWEGGGEGGGGGSGFV